MGVFGASEPAELKPVDPPLAVLPQFCTDSGSSLMIEGGMWEGENFMVKDQRGEPVLKSHGAFNVHGVKTLSDPSGKPVLYVKTTHKNMHRAFVGTLPDSQDQVLDARHDWSTLSKMHIMFVNNSTGKETTVKLSGDMWGRSADLYIEGGPVLAQVIRDPKMGFGKSYLLNVAPGVDRALMVAICVCFDECCHNHVYSG